jgi:hypothetical protein
MLLYIFDICALNLYFSDKTDLYEDDEACCIDDCPDASSHFFKCEEEAAL